MRWRDAMKIVAFLRSAGAASLVGWYLQSRKLWADRSVGSWRVQYNLRAVGCVTGAGEVMDDRVRGCGEAWGSSAVRVPDYPTERSATEEIRTLIAAVEALLPQINAAADSEVDRLRRKARQALAAAQIAVAPRAACDKPYGSARPWAAVGLTVLCALSVGLLAGRAVTERWLR